MTAFGYHYLITIALTSVITWTVGLQVGEWSARREARRQLHRRQVLAGLQAVDSARGRHPSSGAPMVDDFRTHSRLAHQPREVGAEDHQEWAS